MLFSVLLFIGVPIFLGTLTIYILFKIAQLLTSFFTKGVVVALAICFVVLTLEIIDGEAAYGLEFLNEVVEVLGTSVVPFLIDGFVALLEFVV